MSSMRPLGRRAFLKLSVAAGGGLLIGFSLPADAETTYIEEQAGQFSPNAFVRIGTDERITVIVNHSEMGQGVYTSLPMILAEELDADWSKVGYEPAPVAPEYDHPTLATQMTAGKSSVKSGFDQFRKAGAAARVMLMEAAAQRWNVDTASCSTANGRVMHVATNRSLYYGQLAESAALLEPPAQVTLKDAKDFKIIGQPLKRLDTPDKTDGKAIFGIDVSLPGMVIALVARPPMFGAEAKKFVTREALAIPGVKNIVAIPTGVAVIADSFWTAKKAREVLHVEWHEGPMEGFSTPWQMERYHAWAQKPALVARKDGDAESKLSGTGKMIDAEYQVPYLAHATMEPLNCVVDLKDNSCDIWTGAEFQTVDRGAAAEAAFLKPEQVQIHTTLAGGGFGRRANAGSDFVREALSIARQTKGPVKVMWTREDDIQGGYYRPAYLHSIKGVIDSSGNPVAWRHLIVGQSILAGTPFEKEIQNGIDPTSVEGAVDLPYAIPNVTVEYRPTKGSIPVLWWRSVGHSHNAFVTECFLDELAALGKQDPYKLRRKLLAKKPRHLGVLELAAEKAGWGKPLPNGIHRGIAVHESFGTFSAQVAEVSIEDNKVRVHRVVCAIDCGTVVNPSIVEALGQSGVLFGMSAALYDEITFKDGRVQQSNFNDYPLVRMNECPEIEVHVVKNIEKPTGVDESGVPCVAPAIANAVFAATGKPVRKLPIRLEATTKNSTTETRSH